ncbi:MAG: ferrous iron transport protein A [Candidatus Onthomonas sp.]
MVLSEGKVGETYSVQAIHLPFQMERRLQALGMTYQTRLPVVNRKGKGILIVKIRGTRFALGYNITKNIEVRREEP